MTLINLFTFDGTDGSAPNGPLYIDSSGDLFGTVATGGMAGGGLAFELSKTATGYATTSSVLANFNGLQNSFASGNSPIGYPRGDMISDSTGDFFAVSNYGGTSNGGTIFEIKTGAAASSGVQILASLGNASPYGGVEAGVTMDSAGNLFAIFMTPHLTTSVVELVKTATGYMNTVTVLTTLSDSFSLYPAGLTLDGSGDLIGATGGASLGSGEIFEIAKTSNGYASSPVVLATFNGDNGTSPAGKPVFDKAGNLFGETQTGGLHGGGTVFEIAKTATGYASTVTVLASLDDHSGMVPVGQILIDAAGDLFGVAGYDGPGGGGTVFKIAKTAIGYSDAPTVVASFDGTNGTLPRGGLVADANGNLYGVTEGGTVNFNTTNGSIFELEGSGFSVLPPQSVIQAVAWFGGTPGVSSVLIEDSAANIQSNLEKVEAIAQSGNLSSIALTDVGTPTFSISSARLSANLDTLAAISTPISIALTDSGSPTLSIKAALVASDYAALAEINGPYAIHLTDPGIPSITLFPAQMSVIEPILAKISGPYSAVITPFLDDTSISGVPGALGNTVVFPGTAASYLVTSKGDGISFELSWNVEIPSSHSLDTVEVSLSGIQALQFTDKTEIIASQTPSAVGAVSSAQVAELYGAVFGRQPDAAGLAYYEAVAAGQPALPLFQFAQWFLASPEYVNNPTHAYAQTVAGDQKFIVDTYQNLLNRAPSDAEVAYYENNDVAPMLVGVTAGTAAYKTAQFNAHALVLAHVSQSPEFLTDVQVTGFAYADSQHWLNLI